MAAERQAIREAVAEHDWERLRGHLAKRPGQVRHLLAALNSCDETELADTFLAFEVAADVLRGERLADLTRRLMWLLNEESGNSCPMAALALAHIARVAPETVQPHVPVLEVYAVDPSARMAKTVSRALEMIRAVDKPPFSTTSTSREST